MHRKDREDSGAAPILLVAQARPTHVSVESAARILGVSTRTVRRRRNAGRVETRGASRYKENGHLHRAARCDWLDLRVAKAALARERCSRTGVVAPTSDATGTLAGAPNLPRPHTRTKIAQRSLKPGLIFALSRLLENTNGRRLRRPSRYLALVAGQDLNLRPLGYERVSGRGARSNDFP
jgi:hypothetical protein